MIRQSVRRTPRWKSSAAALPEVEWSPQPVMVPGMYDANGKSELSNAT